MPVIRLKLRSFSFYCLMMVMSIYSCVCLYAHGPVTKGPVIFVYILVPFIMSQMATDECTVLYEHDTGFEKVNRTETKLTSLHLHWHIAREWLIKSCLYMFFIFFTIL